MQTQQVTAEMVSRDSKLVDDIISKLLYGNGTAYYTAIMKDITASPDLKYALAHVSLAILEKVKVEFKRPMYLEILYVAGNYIIARVNADLREMKRPFLNPDDYNKAVQMMLLEYLKTHQNDLNMQEVGAKMKQLQTSLVDGSMATKLSNYLKVDRNKLLSAMNRVIKPKPGVVTSKPKTKGVLANESII